MKGLRHIRKKAGITQRQLAEKLHVAPSTVSRWEKGITFPKPYRAYLVWDIAECLGVTIGDILDPPIDYKKEELGYDDR